MKKIVFGIIAGYFLFIMYAGCSSVSRDSEKRVIAEANKYKMTIEDLRYKFKNAPYDEKTLIQAENGRREYLDRLLEKEILLQEAQKQGLDREKDFMKSIENYWEQALLKLLLQRKSEEISSLIQVTESEVEKYYRDSGEKMPVSKAQGEISKIIRQKKETDMMNKWIEELRKKSYIKINYDLLKEAWPTDKDID